MFDVSPTQSLLSLDPDLGQFLLPERLEPAARELGVRVVTSKPGPWHPDRLRALQNPASIGLLVVDGAIVREIRVHDAPSAELFGPGDVIRLWQAERPSRMEPASVDWSVLGTASVALLDSRTALLLRRYPEVMTVVLDRLNARAERFAVTQAISQITGVETRVEALLWHLSERWGRVGKDGVIIALDLSHRMLGSLVGARRPTVSTALSRLASEERVLRRADGTWLLAGLEPPVDKPAADDSLLLDQRRSLTRHATMVA